MKLENEFVVPAPADEVWSFMLDVERVAPCMPGAEITEQVDERSWKGKVSIKLGPVSMAFQGTVVQETVDEDAKRAVLNAKGQETRGKGAVSAVITSHLEETDAGTKVVVETDLQISGAAAQYGRGMIADVSKRFTDQFADCLAEEIGSGTGGSVGGESGSGESAVRESVGGESVGGETAGVAAEGEPRPGGTTAGQAPAQGARREPRKPAKPIGGLRLAVWAVFRAIGRGIRRLFGGGDDGDGAASTAGSGSDDPGEGGAGGSPTRGSGPTGSSASG